MTTTDKKRKTRKNEMTKPSKLRDFSTRNIEDLLREGVHMVYQSPIKADGYYSPDSGLIEIKPNPKQYEDVTILHEWLHAYEDRILDLKFREKQIDWWAYYHYKNNKSLVDYIRSFFRKQKF
ncbi:MAG: hypothetical protein ABIA37_05105 [Candidatus Woesearchaeota archaeon]